MAEGFSLQGKHVGFSSLKAARLGLAEFKASFSSWKGTAAMQIGSAVHALLAGEDPVFGEILKVGERRAAGSAAWKAEDVFKVQKIAQRVRELGFVEDGEAEQEYFVEYDGLVLRAKPDLWNKDTGVLVDYKTTSQQSVTQQSALYIIKDYYYYAQLAYYAWIVSEVDGVPVREHVITFISTSPISGTSDFFNCKRVVLGEDFIEAGREFIISCLGKISEYRDRGFVEDIEDFRSVLCRPKWL